MDLPDIAVFFGVSFVAAAVNAVAGGGTFLLFPVLILHGMGAIAANIMCTVAMWTGSIASALAYRGQLQVEKQQLKQLVIVSMLGSALGTATLLVTPEVTFRTMVPWLLLVATAIFTFGRHGISWLRLHPQMAGRHQLAAFLFQFTIAAYGGYFGAGIGILMLAMLQLMGMSDIHRMNALKMVLGASINAVAVAIFVASGRVIWDAGLVMITGGVLGGWFGARAALLVAPQKVRLIVSFIGFAMTAYFFIRPA